MKTFITNDENNNLRDRLNTLCKYSKNIDFLVGFVYFNGLKEICESMRQNPNLNLRLLVGLKIDKSTAGVLFEAESVSNDNATIKEDLNQSFNNVRSHCDFDNLDSLNILELFKLFIDTGRIQIRKTLEPNHAKLYLFDLENQAFNGSMITGSSNLTKRGILEQQEFNVEIYAPEYYHQGKEYFEELWSTSKDVTEEFVEILKISETNYIYTPYETFALVLHLYLQNYIEAEASQNLIDLMDKYHYKLFNYQLDAMEQAYSIIKDYNGVIIADVVGLGKSVITSMLLNKMKKRVCVICPPSLQAGWASYLDDFEVNYKIFSQGKLDDAEAYVLRNEPQVIVIDEAHKYRNRSNDTYDQIYKICHHQDSEGNEANIILLTATPFNNNVNDILSLLKLFLINVDNTSLVENGKLSVILNGFSKRLKYLFDIKRYKDEERGIKLFNNYFNKRASAVNLVLVREEETKIFNQVKEIIRPVIIRRNRIDLKTKRYKEAIENCSNVNAPNPIYYCMTKEQSEFYDTVIKYFDPENESLNKFIGASYIPENYITKDAKDRENLVTQNNIVRFLRSLFIKRFESCFESFNITLTNMVKYQKLKLKYLGFDIETLLSFDELNSPFRHYIDSVEVVNKYTLDNSYIEKYFEAVEDDEEEIPDIYEYVAAHNKTSSERQNQIYDIKDLYRRHQFIFDICQDIKLFDFILSEMERLELVKTDPKFEELKKVLKQDRKGKILVFSEYKDTVHYLRRKLEESASLKDKIMYAYNSVSSSKLESIRKEFDASYNKENQKQENNFQILIGTDVISEGLNLNRADTIINYDIPWNPVRVIQRVGRINRIGQKVFKELHIFNFFPSEIGESLTHIKAIAENKMLLIHNSLGEDVQIFTDREKPTASGLFDKINSLDDDSEKSFETIVKEDYEKIKEEHPEVIEKIVEHKQFIKASKEYDTDEMFLFAFTTRLIPLTFDEEGVPVSVNLEDIYNSIKCEYDTKNIFNKDVFSWEKYEKLRDFYLKDTSKAPNRINPNSTHGKAINNLRALISKKPDYIKNYLKEVKDLLNLIQKSEIVSIKDMRELEKINDVNDIDTLKELHKQYCNEKAISPVTINKNVIVAIENRQPDIFS